MSEAIDYRTSHTTGAISITGVSKSFGKHKALDAVSLSLDPGSVTVILGPSGSGKSTLLRTINHLERVDEGFIQIDGDYIGYQQRGDKLYELKEQAGATLMTCRHCLRYAHGECPRETGRAPRWKEPLALRLPNGRTFPLTFDCAKCEMSVHHD